MCCFAAVPGVRASLQCSDLYVSVEDMEQSSELSDHRVSLRNTDLRHWHQHLQFHLLATAGFCRHDKSSVRTNIRELANPKTQFRSHLVVLPRWQWRCWSGLEHRLPSTGTGTSPGPGWSGKVKLESPSHREHPANTIIKDPCPQLYLAEIVKVLVGSAY